MRCRMNSTSGTARIACGGVRVRAGVKEVGVVVRGGVGRAGQRASRLACSSASPHAAAPAASANSVTSAPLAAVALTCSRWKPACDHATGQGYRAGLEARAGGRWRPLRLAGVGGAGRLGRGRLGAWAAWGVGGTSRSLRTKLVSPRKRSSTCVAQRWPASRMRPAELTWPSRVSHSSDAKRAEPALSGRKRMPHSTQPCCSEICLSAAGSTVSSAPQKPRHLRRIGSSAPPLSLGRDDSILQFPGFVFLGRALLVHVGIGVPVAALGVTSCSAKLARRRRRKSSRPRTEPPAYASTHTHACPGPRPVHCHHPRAGRWNRWRRHPAAPVHGAGTPRHDVLRRGTVGEPQGSDRGE